MATFISIYCPFYVSQSYDSTMYRLFVINPFCVCILIGYSWQYNTYQNYWFMSTINHIRGPNVKWVILIFFTQLYVFHYFYVWVSKLVTQADESVCFQLLIYHLFYQCWHNERRDYMSYSYIATNNTESKHNF